MKRMMGPISRNYRGSYKKNIYACIMDQKENDMKMNEGNTNLYTVYIIFRWNYRAKKFSFS